jgi:hypothetical protein
MKDSALNASEKKNEALKQMVSHVVKRRENGPRKDADKWQPGLPVDTIGPSERKVLVSDAILQEEATKRELLEEATKTAEGKALNARQRAAEFRSEALEAQNAQAEVEFQMLELLRLEEESERFRLDREAAAAWKISQVIFLYFPQVFSFFKFDIS